MPIGLLIHVGHQLVIVLILAFRFVHCHIAEIVAQLNEQDIGAVQLSFLSILIEQEFSSSRTRPVYMRDANVAAYSTLRARSLQ